jgi:hypothetical protein
MSTDEFAHDDPSLPTTRGAARADDVQEEEME